VSTNAANTEQFELGQTFITPGALEALRESGQAPHEFLLRHVAGDWGELSEDDRNENERSLQHGFRLLSAYSTSRGRKIWILTEWDRSATTILIPDEY